MERFTISGHVVDIFNQSTFPANVLVEDGYIIAIDRIEKAPVQYILPGFIDAHIHIESSMLVPSEFAKMAVVHGTVATVSDPHEIANVCGLEGVEFMIQNAKDSPFKFFFGAPSCVPATPFENAGAVLDSQAVGQLLQRDEIKYLSEMMNYPGVLNGDEEVIAKIKAAQNMKKPIDGHAPGLRGKEMRRYIQAGISTDHECTNFDEAMEKLEAGMLILIREGSAAKNFDALVDLFDKYPKSLMFCSDDKHPDALVKGHMNQLVAKAIQKGYDLYDVLYAACILPVQHYQLNVGQLKVGDPADFIIVKDLKSFIPIATYINGVLVAQEGKSLIETSFFSPINHFHLMSCQKEDFEFSVAIKKDKVRINVLEVLDGQLITRHLKVDLKAEEGIVKPDIEKDVLMVGVYNRYQQNSTPSLGFVKGFGLKKGAIASSVAHDSHNIVFVGCDAVSIFHAVNAIIEAKGGISCYDGSQTHLMELPVAGLMSVKDANTAAQEYEKLDAIAKQIGSSLTAPFMTLSFIALPVIPDLKITDKGLFDVTTFQFIDVVADE